jgi:hypothetical protein
MDFTGRGFVSKFDFLDSLVVTRIAPFTKEDVEEFFKQHNIFQNEEEKGMTFDFFKKTFFPQFYLINDEEESDEDRKIKQTQNDLKKNREK